MVMKGLNFFQIPYNGDRVNEICMYVRELKKWNQYMNLTGLKELDLIVSELLYDAFFLCGYMKEMKTVLDLGSGAGILAIPITILSENLKICSVDKSLKKIQFQRHIKRLVSLKNIVPVHDRAEVLEPMETDALIAKGFGSVEEILGKGGKHIRPEGYAFILKGKNEEPIEYPGFKLNNVIQYLLPVSDKAYRLFIYKKY